MIRPAHCFSTEMQELWFQGGSEPIVCLKCMKEGRAISTAAMHFCQGCKEERPEYQFLEERIVACMAGTDQAEELRCIHCDMQRRTDLDESKVYPCSTCKKQTHLRDFSPADQKEWLGGKRNYFRWVCYECRFPRCTKCQESDDPLVQARRPVHAVKHNAFVDGKYYCLKCRYPPCQGCGKEAPSTKYRLKVWSCKECLSQGTSNGGQSKAFQGSPITLP